MRRNRVGQINEYSVSANTLYRCVDGFNEGRRVSVFQCQNQNKHLISCFLDRYNIFQRKNGKKSNLKSDIFPNIYQT